MTNCSSSPELCELEQGVRIIQLTKLACVSSLALYLYDFLLTYSDEQSYIFGLGKIVYFLVRYMTLFVLM
ncbi:hypothetical protein ACEPAF_2974 [Sanghuangporus sanghuang]